MPEEAVGGDDGEFETKDAAAVTLYKVSDAGGSLNVEPISTKPFRQDMLKTEVSARVYYLYSRAKIFYNYFLRRIALFWTLVPVFMRGSAKAPPNKKSPRLWNVPKVILEKRYIYTFHAKLYEFCLRLYPNQKIPDLDGSASAN